jgi:biotin synthase
VKLNTIINMKSGLCPEDCSYCSQRRGSTSDILKYTWIDSNDVIDLANQAIARGAKRICLVASGRGPSQPDITRVADSIREIT